jgi:hypothetical protein
MRGSVSGILLAHRATTSKGEIAEVSEQTGRGNRQKNWLVIVLTVGMS